MSDVECEGSGQSAATRNLDGRLPRGTCITCGREYRITAASGITRHRKKSHA